MSRGSLGAGHALCERPVVGARRVMRYGLRDSGESTTAGPKAPACALRDLAPGAAVLARAVQCSGTVPRGSDWAREQSPAHAPSTPG